MNQQVKWIAILGAIALLGVLTYSSLQQTQYHYDVCVTFHGRSHCATAAGRTKTEAIRSAQEIDCTLLAASREENMACLDATPSSIQPISRK